MRAGLLCLLLLAAPAGAQVLTNTMPEDTAERCANGLDDDGDGLTDCTDDGCDRFCAAPATPTPPPRSTPAAPGPPTPAPAPASAPAAQPAPTYRAHGPPPPYPQRQAERPLTLARGTVALGSGFYGLHAGQLLGGFRASIRYGVTDFIEVWAQPLLGSFTPGDAQIWSPRLGGRVAFEIEPDLFSFGLFAELVIPVDEGLGFFFRDLPYQAYDRAHLALGIPLRLQLGEVGRIDADPARFWFFLAGADTDVVFITYEPTVSLLFNLGSFVHVGARARLSTVIASGDVDFSYTALDVGPLAGVSIGNARGAPIVDLDVRFGFPELYLDSDAGRGAYLEEVWELGIDATFYIFTQ
jgi:hypothetical protein